MFLPSRSNNVSVQSACSTMFEPIRDGSQLQVSAFDCMLSTVVPGLSRLQDEVASPSIPSWNQIAEFLKTMKQLRDSSGFVA